MDRLAAGAVLDGNYEILAVLGEGTMGVVYKARHRLMNRLVALKMLPGHLAADETSAKRFRQEARAASGLSHPNIVAVHDFGVLPGGEAYLVMDYLDGHSLDDELRERRCLPWTEAIPIFRQCCVALAHAHKHGVIHRDLKPSNIMLINEPDGRRKVCIVDFGIARVFDSSGLPAQRLTKTGESFGSPLHMAPEQIQGQQVDARTDIYSLGCVMYESLAGTSPFEGLSPADIARQHLTKVAQPLSMVVLEPIPKTLDDVVGKAMAKDAAERYNSMDDLELALAAIASGANGNGSASVSAGAALKRSSICLLPQKRKWVLVGAALVGTLFWLTCTESGTMSCNWLSLSLKEVSVGPDDPSVIPLLEKLEENAKLQGNYEEAARLRLRSLPAIEKFGKKKQSLQLILAQADLADAYEKAGHPEKARELQNRMLPSINLLSGLLLDYQDYPAVINITNLEIKYRTAMQEKDRNDLAVAYLRLARSYMALADSLNAKKAYRTQLDLIKDNIFRRRDLIYGFAELSGIYLKDGEPVYAEQLCEQAWKESFNFDPDQKLIGTLQKSLADVHTAMKKYKQAVAEYKTSIEAFESIDDLQDAETSLDGYIELSRQTKDYALMEKLVARRLEIESKIQGQAAPPADEHERVDKMLAQVEKGCDHAGSMRLLERLCALEIKREGKARTDTLNRLAEAYFYAGQLDRSADSYRQLISLSGDSSSVRVVVIRKQLANILLCQHKPDQAIKLLVAIADDLKNAPKAPAYLLVEAYTSLAQAQGQKKDYNGALQSLQSALHATRGSGQEMQRAAARALRDSAICCLESGQDKRAMLYIEEAFKAASQEAPDKQKSSDLATILDCQARLGLRMKDYARAESAAKTAVGLSDSDDFISQATRRNCLITYRDILRQVGGKPEDGQEIDRKLEHVQTLIR